MGLSGSEENGLVATQVIFGSISALLALVVIISLLVHQRHKLPSYRLYLSLACANFLSGLAWATPNDFTWQSPSRAAACWDDSLANGMLYTIVLIEIGILGFTLGHVKFHKPKFSERVVHLVPWSTGMVATVIFGIACGTIDHRQRHALGAFFAIPWLVLVTLAAMGCIWVYRESSTQQKKYLEERGEIEELVMNGLGPSQLSVLDIRRNVLRNALRPLKAFPLVYLVFAVPTFITVVVALKYRNVDAEPTSASRIFKVNGVFAALRGVFFFLVFMLDADCRRDTRPSILLEHLKRLYRRKTQPPTRVTFHEDPKFHSDYFDATTTAHPNTTRGRRSPSPPPAGHYVLYEDDEGDEDELQLHTPSNSHDIALEAITDYSPATVSFRTFADTAEAAAAGSGDEDDDSAMLLSRQSSVSFSRKSSVSWSTPDHSYS